MNYALIKLYDMTDLKVQNDLKMLLRNRLAISNLMIFRMSRLVLISTTCMCINTFPWMQTTDINGESIDNPNLAMIEVT